MKYCLRCNQPLKPNQKFYGQHEACFKKVFQLDAKTKFESLAPKSFTSDSNGQNPNKNSPHLTSYFAGNYKKYEGKLGAHSYILKFSKEDYPELAPVEFVCNKIGFFCGINVAKPFTLIEFEKGELAFVSKNFMDQQTAHANLNAIYHYVDAGPKNYTVENISQAIFREARSAPDVFMFFRILLFDALIGNHDRHGRNLSLIETAQQKRLSPIYDNPSYLGLESGALLKANFTVHGKIGTKKSDEPQILDYAVEIERLGAGSVVEDFVSTTKIDKIKETILKTTSLSENMRQALYKMVVEQYKKLKDYVQTK